MENRGTSPAATHATLSYKHTTDSKIIYSALPVVLTAVSLGFLVPSKLHFGKISSPKSRSVFLKTRSLSLARFKKSAATF